LGEEPNSPKEANMLDMVKKAMLTGVGFAVKTWDKGGSF